MSLSSDVPEPQALGAAPDSTAPGAPPPSAAPVSTVPALGSARRPPLGRVLVETGVISEKQLAHALALQDREGKRLTDTLLADRSVSREALGRASAARLRVPFFDLLQGVDPSVAGALDPSSARHYQAVPVGRDPQNRLLIAMADPSDVLAIDDLRLLTRSEVVPLYAYADDIQTLLGEQSSLDDVVAGLVDESADGEPFVEDGRDQAVISDSAHDAPVVRLVNSLIVRAVDERASDIHFEPQAGEMVVRYRVDGVLRVVASVPARLAAGVASRVKVMADLDIAERRHPQDGRVGLTVGEQSLDLRVATLPTVYGEKIVIRVLDKSNILMQLTALGFARDTLAAFEGCYRRPHGAVLVTGPTGSGKSTTLYGALNQLNSSEKNIITVEDPVEYRLRGINQVQVNPKAGLTFATGLRSILRCDPDVVMIGEIRDRETAQIAVESALTGHMVLATLHTNDAPSALTRLTEMGVEPFLSASAVVGILAQRLVRRLCDHCKRSAPVSHATLAEVCQTTAIPPTLPDPAPAFEPVGCSRCGGLGYRGRLGVFELLTVSEAIQKLALEASSSEEIMRRARADGMRTLLEDGMLKVVSGQTSMKEMARAVG